MTGTMAVGSGRGNGLRPFVWAGAVCLLLLPAAAMRFFPDAGVHWSGMDFVVMGALLAGACGLYELGARLGRARAYRAGFGLAVLTGFLTVWVNLAVGMLGDEGDPANLSFLGVLAMAALGSATARFQPAGMAKAMFATAAAQLVVVGVALAMGRFAAPELALGACFALPWLLAGALFRRAARGLPAQG